MLIGGCGFRKEMRAGLDVGTLALSFWKYNSRLLDRLEAPFELRWRLNPRSKRIAPMAQRDTPVCDRTGWVGGENGVECIDGAAKLERMHESYGTIELRLNRAAARSSEDHTAQSFRRIVMTLCLRGTRGR